METLSVTAVRNLGLNVEEDPDWGPNGVLDAGDLVYGKNKANALYVSYADIASDRSLDAFLEKVSGARIDLVRAGTSAMPGYLKYLVSRDVKATFGKIRIVDAVRGQAIGVPEPANFTSPNYSGMAQRLFFRQAFECGGYLYGDCSTNLSLEYSVLQASARQYSSVAASYQSAHTQLAKSTKTVVTLFDLEGSPLAMSGFIALGQQANSAQADYQARWASFNRPVSPWPVPGTPDADPDWDPVPTPPPTPDADPDWDIPSSTKSAPPPTPDADPDWE